MKLTQALLIQAHGLKQAQIIRAQSDAEGAIVPQVIASALELEQRASINISVFDAAVTGAINIPSLRWLR